MISLACIEDALSEIRAGAAHSQYYIVQNGKKILHQKLFIIIFFNKRHYSYNKLNTFFERGFVETNYHLGCL